MHLEGCYQKTFRQTFLWLVISQTLTGPIGEVKPVAPPRKPNRVQEDLQPIGIFTRQTLEVWRSVLGSVLKATGDSRVIQTLFHRMDIFPSQAQVHEMLELSRETRSHSETNFTYGAFTFYAAEMKYSERKMKCNPRRKLSCGSPSLLRQPCRLVSQTSYDVFLGGSCNPSQWRRDEAIPALKAAQVTFYNPQREDWLPNLINLEQQAKDNARVLLFVHDKETRSLASMVEVGERSALKKQTLVLAIEELGDQVMGEKLSERELKEMRRGRNYMRDIAEKNKIRVFTEIRDAVQSCIDIVKGNCSRNDQRLFPQSDLGEKFINFKHAFDNYASNNKLSREERNLAFRGLHGRDIPKEIQMDEKDYINETEFSEINSEYRFSTRPSGYLSNLTHWWNSSDKILRMDKGVFICGPVGDFDWKTEIAHPILEKNHVPTREMSDADAQHLMPTEMKLIEKSRVLLFVFPSDTYGAAEMIMASYYIALGRQVVLCTQQVCENTSVYGDRLTAYQAKDYNRCRMYLSDQAFRNKVPVYDSIPEAVAKAAELAAE